MLSSKIFIISFISFWHLYLCQNEMIDFNKSFYFSSSSNLNLTVVKSLSELIENINQYEKNLYDISSIMIINSVHLEVLIDSDEKTLWNDQNNFSLLLNGILAEKFDGRLPYTLRFLPLIENTMVSINVGCFLRITGFRSVSFENIIFKPVPCHIITTSIYYDRQNYYPNFDIFAFYIHLFNCQLQFTGSDILIENGKLKNRGEAETIILYGEPMNILGFYLTATMATTIESFSILNIDILIKDEKFKSFLSIIYSDSFSIEINNLKIDGLNFENGYSIIKLSENERFKANLKGISILNTKLLNTPFLYRNGKLTSFQIKNFSLYKTIVKEKDFIVLNSPTDLHVQINDIAISHSEFSSSLGSISIFKLVRLHLVGFFQIYGCSFDGGRVFSINMDSFQENNTIEFSNFWMNHNSFLVPSVQNCFFFEFKLFLIRDIILKFTNLSFASNKFEIQEKNCYAIQIYGIELIILKKINFTDNDNASGVYFEDLNEIEIYYFAFIKHKAVVKGSISLYFLNINSKLNLFDVSIYNSYFESGLIIILLQDTYNNNIKLTFTYLNIDTISSNNYNVGSSLIIKCILTLAILIQNSKFTNIRNLGFSTYQENSGAISIDSPTSVCTIKNSNFINITSNGESNVFFGRLGSIFIYDSNFESANYFSLSNYTNSDSQLLNDGSFLNILFSKILISNSKFIGAYSYYGGAIALVDSKRITNLTIINSTFEKISSIYEGGVIYVNKKTSEDIFVNLSGCTFYKVSSASTGGVIRIQSPGYSTFFIEHCKFSNFNSKEGGIIQADACKITLKYSEICYNYDSFSQETFLLFQKLKLISNFSAFYGQIFSFGKTEVEFISNKFHDLLSSYIDNFNPLIFVLNSGKFTDDDSSYKNMSISHSLFKFTEEAEVNFNKVYIFNISTEKDTSNANSSKVDLEQNSLFEVTDSFLNISSNYFEKLCLQQKSNIIHATDSIIEILSSIFSQTSAYNEINSGISSKFVINKCIFENNIALENAGCFVLYASFVFITRNIFINNFVLNGYGGAVSLLYDDLSQKSRIENNNFLNNSALVGGAIYYKYKELNLPSSNIFEKNKAEFFGNNLYSNPYYLCFISNPNQTLKSNCSESKETILNFRSGAMLPNFYLQILDEESNYMTNLEKLLKIDSDFNFTIKMNIVSPNEKDTSIYLINSTKRISEINFNNLSIFPIENLIIIGKPQTTIQLKFSSESIISLILNENIRSNYSINFSVNFRNCVIGEYFQSYSGICYICPEKTYSFNPDKEYCNSCPLGLSCKGGAKTIVNGNYWRYNKFFDYVFFCQKIPEACIGGENHENDMCSYGRIGARCESCDLVGTYWNSSFARTSSLGCVKCDEIVSNYIILVILSLFNFLSMALSIKGTIDNIDMKLKLKVIGVFARYGMFKTIKNESSIFIKIYFSYFQIIQVLSVLNLEYPTWINSLGTTAGTPINTALYSTDCLIAEFSTKIPYLYVKLLVALLIPCIYLFIFVFGYVLFVKKSRYHKKFSMLYTVCLFTLLYFQPSIIENIIAVLSCVRLGDESYIKADLAYKCSDPTNNFYSSIIGIPALFFWAIGTPGFILYRLIKNRNLLQRLSKYIRYGYLYDEYLIFYWEFIRMYEKFLITIVISFFETEIIIKGLLVLMIIAIYQQLLYKKNPYKTKNLNKIDKLNGLVCFSSVLLGVFTYKNQYQVLVDVTFIIIMALNLFFNLLMWKNILSAYSHQFDDKLVVLHRKLIKILPLIRIIYPAEPEFKTRKYWLKVRRFVGRYLREKERIKLRKKSGMLNDEEMYTLTLNDYDHQAVGVNKTKVVKFKKEKMGSEIFDLESICETPFDSIIKKENAEEIERNVIRLGINEENSSSRNLH